MLSLARGLAVLRAFVDQPSLTVSSASNATGLPRASVRRCLHTLDKLGYVALRDGAYVLRPALLPLARAYLPATRIGEVAQPVLARVRDRIAESCSLGVLDGDSVVYIARAESRQIIAVALHVGSRVPAYCTSLGRVLLAHAPPADLRRYLRQAPFPTRTPRTVTAATALLEILEDVRSRGHALVEEEFERGLRSLSVPVRSSSGEVIAAMNVGAPADRVSRADMRQRILPELMAAATELGGSLGG